MNAMALITLVALGFDGANQPARHENDQAAIQGVWHGTGRSSHLTLVFCGDTVTGINERVEDVRWREMESTFRLVPGGQQIDINRPDGMQLGHYMIEGDKLTIQLGAPSEARAAALAAPETKPPVKPLLKRDRPAGLTSRCVLERAK